MKEIKGFLYPLKFGPLGHLDTGSGTTKLVSNVRRIVDTRYGDRPVSPSFGHLGYDSLLRNLDETTFGTIKSVLREALVEHEDRLIVLDIRITADNEEGKAYVLIDFQRKDTGEFGTLERLLGDE